MAGGPPFYQQPCRLTALPLTALSLNPLDQQSQFGNDFNHFALQFKAFNEILVAVKVYHEQYAPLQAQRFSSDSASA